MLKKICTYQGCTTLIDYPNTRCDNHKRQESKQYDKQRGTASQRGYDSKWVKVRDLKLKQNPLCEMCLNDNKTTLATLVHHIKLVSTHPELRLVMSNLMSLCVKCHDEIHNEQGDKW